MLSHIKHHAVPDHTESRVSLDETIESNLVPPLYDAFPSYPSIPDSLPNKSASLPCYIHSRFPAGTQSNASIVLHIFTIVLNPFASNSLSTTIRNLQPLLQIPARIHQAPFILPLLARGVELHFPRLVKSFEPFSISKHSNSLFGL
jgi:hypothetical protein